MVDAYDAIVIGGGILGVTTTYNLARAGQKVALLEANTIAKAASNNSFAWLNSHGKDPGPYHDLNVAGMKEYSSLEEQVHTVDVHRTGSLYWAASKADDDFLINRYNTLTSLDYAVEMMDRKQAQQLEPCIKFPEIAEQVLFCNDEAWVDPPQIISALLGASSENIDIFENVSVQSFNKNGDVITDIKTTNGTFTADSIIICAGVSTGLLADSIQVPVPVNRKPGFLIVTSPVPPETLSRVVHHGRAAYTANVAKDDISCHLRPDISGGIRIGADLYDMAVDEKSIVDPIPSFAYELHDLAKSVLPALENTEIAKAHLGIRPIPADGFTVAGLLPQYKNAYVAVTHSAVTMGPLIGRLVSEEVLGNSPDPLLKEFRPERFSS